MLLRAEEDITVAGVSGSGLDAVQATRRLQPDVVLMDVRMPELDGIQATRDVTFGGFAHDADRPIKVLILTMYNIGDVVYSALRAGAAGDRYLARSVPRRLLKDFASHHGPHSPTPAKMSSLTTRKCEILIHIAHGMSNQEIAATLKVGEATVGRVLIKWSCVTAFQSSPTTAGSSYPD